MSKNQMLINYVPGDECRVAILRDGRLEEFFAERMNAASAVGNIAVGRVTNVESAIQAAFVDFGHEHNGFLHITDLHPRYFPGEDDEATERVGKKTPRRERPPIQRALKRGQEVVVQVIKEGIGTKGPTLSTYLSIPGRFLVMMPDMDKVGVSRKVEDEDQRREMRKVLDQLDLPEGFGFILRTAGMGRTKTDLKRDLAYLQRLWRDMEDRRKKGKAPRLLYAESDLLVRTLRDVLTSEIDEVVIDHPAALKRAANFMKIVSPRAQAKLLEYDRKAPLFHAFGVEEQIDLMHSREVPLSSGGRLVIDETEALVAIDVNSGKSRSAGDAETNAVRTNLEAADEICRQLKLRDLGGLVVLDLIDMRHRSNRAKVEARFKDNFKRDRARTKVLSISQLGLIELTRQRMRGSVLNTQYADCPTCTGFGKVQRPGFVAADGMRELGALLHHERVAKVEMVVSPRVASEYLTNKRRAIGQLEFRTGKTVEIRVSETIPVDRVTYYAYDDRGADIAIDKLPRAQAPKDLKPWVKASGKDSDWAVDPQDEAEQLAEAEAELFEEEEELIGDLISEDFSEDDAEAGGEGGGKKKRRRRGRRGRRGRGGGDDHAEDRTDDHAGDRAQAHDDGRGDDQRESRDERDQRGEGDEGEGGGKRRRRRRRRRGGKSSEDGGESRREPEKAQSGDEPREERRESRRDQERPERRSSGRSSRERDSGERQSRRSSGGHERAKSEGSTPPPPPPSASPASSGASGGVVRKAWGFGIPKKKEDAASKPTDAGGSKADSGGDDKPAGEVKKPAPRKRSSKKTASKKTAKKSTGAESKKKSAKKTTKKATRKKSTKKTAKKASSRKKTTKKAPASEES